MRTGFPKPCGEPVLLIWTIRVSGSSGARTSYATERGVQMSQNMAVSPEIVFVATNGLLPFRQCHHQNSPGRVSAPQTTNELKRAWGHKAWDRLKDFSPKSGVGHP